MVVNLLFKTLPGIHGMIYLAWLGERSILPVSKSRLTRDKGTQMARILVIDDEPQFRRTLTAILTKADYEVTEADNGKKALDLLRAAACDLVITDIFMPEKEGIETITEIKKTYPQTKIIAVSGGSSFNTKDFLSVAKKLGADVTIQKPFERKVILDAVAELLA